MNKNNEFLKRQRPGIKHSLYALFTHIHVIPAPSPWGSTTISTFYTTAIETLKIISKITQLGCSWVIFSSGSKTAHNQLKLLIIRKKALLWDLEIRLVHSVLIGLKSSLSFSYLQKKNRLLVKSFQLLSLYWEPFANHIPYRQI